MSFVALYSTLGDRFSLLCIESRSGRPLWKTSVWALGAEVVPYGIGVRRHDLGIICTGRQVAVFGDDGDSCYLEAFDTQTGKNIFRFSTNYWNVKQLRTWEEEKGGGKGVKKGVVE
jgi:hypothetical protein